MSILTDLRAALEARVEAAVLLVADDDGNRAIRRYEDAADSLYDLLTDDTIRALLDVAEEGVCPMCRMRMVEGEYLNGDDEWVTCRAVYHAALAPLVKEADHDRA